MGTGLGVGPPETRYDIRNSKKNIVYIMYISVFSSFWYYIYFQVWGYGYSVIVLGFRYNFRLFENSGIKIKLLGLFGSLSWILGKILNIFRVFEYFWVFLGLEYFLRSSGWIIPDLHRGILL